MTGQNDRPDESLTGQAHDQAGHCPLTGRYFEPCKHIGEFFLWNNPKGENYTLAFCALSF